jgi:dihydrofolate reductase
MCVSRAPSRFSEGSGFSLVRSKKRVISVELEGGTTFTFGTDDIESALERARRAALGKDVSFAGGASAAQQYLAAGLVDEMEISVVPTLLGSGERLFDGVGDELHGLELVRTVAARKVTHLKFARR